jgi:hypothetical protein
MIAKKVLIIILPLAIFCGGCRTINPTLVEELRATTRRISEIEGEIDNSLQILAHAAEWNGDNPEARSTAMAGISKILGVPDDVERAYAESLDSAEKIKPVVDHALALQKKLEQVRGVYSKKEYQLRKDYAHMYKISSCFEIIFPVLLIVGVVVVVYFVRKLLVW